MKILLLVVSHARERRVLGKIPPHRPISAPASHQALKRDVQSRPIAAERRCLFPLNRPRRLACDVIGHAIDPAHLVHNPRRDAIEEAHIKRIDIRRHAIRAGHDS